MSTSDSSTALRAQVDLAIPSIYENLFAALDLLLQLTHSEQGPTTARAAQLRALLADELHRLDCTDPSSARTVIATGCPRCGGCGDRCSAPTQNTRAQS